MLSHPHTASQTPGVSESFCLWCILLPTLCPAVNFPSCLQMLVPTFRAAEATVSQPLYLPLLLSAGQLERQVNSKPCVEKRRRLQKTEWCFFAGDREQRSRRELSECTLLRLTPLPAKALSPRPLGSCVHSSQSERLESA